MKYKPQIKIVSPAFFKTSQTFYAPLEILHRAGAEEFGSLWMGANENVVDILRSWGIDPSPEATRQFFALLTLRILRAGAPSGKRSRLLHANGTSTGAGFLASQSGQSSQSGPKS